jgi:hypothetical protein
LPGGGRAEQLHDGGDATSRGSIEAGCLVLDESEH